MTLTFDGLTMRRFYFEIPSANVLECIWAHSFFEAKAKASLDLGCPGGTRSNGLTRNER
jgi:hypothetical protein